MIALDTNLLVYSYDRSSVHHPRAIEAVREVIESPAWGLPWSVVHEYLKILTEGRTSGGRVAPETALRSVDSMLAAPGVQLLAEPAGYWRVLRRLLVSSSATGPLIFDARIAATCIGHGVSELLTADRHFDRFPALRTRNPLIG